MSKKNNKKEKFLNKIKKIAKSNSFWILSTFLIYIFVIVALNPKILEVPYLFAEDGTIFISQFMKSGLESFTLTYGGYYNTLSRIFAMIATFFASKTNSVIVLANVTEWLSIAFAAFVAAYFTSDSFNGIVKTRFKRFLISLLVIIFMSNFAWLLYTGVSIHWWCGLLIFLVSLNLLNKKTPSFLVLPFILISIISSPSSMIIAFAMIYYVIKQIDIKLPIKTLFSNIEKKDLIKLLLMGIFILIQAYAILFVTDVDTLVKPDLSLSRMIDLIYYTFSLFLSSINFIFGTDVFLALANVRLNNFTGAILWLLVIYLSSKTKVSKYCWLTILNIIFLYFMINFKRVDFIAYYNDIMGPSYQVWYHSLPAIFTFILIMIMFVKYSNLSKSFKYVEICFIVIFSIFTIHNINHPEFETANKLKEINQYVDYSNDKYIKVHISPNFLEWYVPVPVSDEYCEENVCDSTF